MHQDKKYHAKLMIAGEYGVIAGSNALTIPLPLFNAQLKNQSDADNNKFDSIAASVSSLRKLITYISALPKNSFYAKPEIKKLGNILSSGFFIDSTIPNGYGIGSSGAVSALIYDQFFTRKENLELQQIHKDLAAIESCFHGKSSGVDAMACYIHAPLHFLNNGTINILNQDPIKQNTAYSFFLLDSGKIFETGPLVSFFLENMKDETFIRKIKGEYLPLIKKLINALINKTDTSIAILYKAISEFQYKNFERMIPQNIENIWLEGILNNIYYLKLNGSGGGFVLGMTLRDNQSVVEDILKDFDLTWL